MNEINNHERYREVISRIKTLSATRQDTIFNFEELAQLRAMAIAYELKRYDFTIGLTDTRQFSIAI
ncbi:hypothetical protein G6M26_06820 [Agrobacterium tumefaciens]|nr:hypothetical protein [Agrobacterium tumefaciens]NTE18230.1 hypothetical protein [Agrobacterium tumefaciens]